MPGGLGVGMERGEKGSLNAGDPIITPAKKMIEQIPMETPHLGVCHTPVTISYRWAMLAGSSRS